MQHYTCHICSKICPNYDFLRRHVSRIHAISSEQICLEYKYFNRPPLCHCGCGHPTRFRNGDFQKFITKHFIPSTLGRKRPEEEKQHLSKVRKSKWESGEYKAYQKGKKWDELYDKETQNYILQKIQSPERADNISSALKGKKKSKEHVAKIAKNRQEYWSKEEHRDEQRTRRLQYFKDKGFSQTSKLEDIFSEILDKFQICYERYVILPNSKSIFDFLIPSLRIIIQIDGDFWHCNPNGRFPVPKYKFQFENIKRDENKKVFCKENNYTLIRFWEKDIKERPEWIKEQLSIILSSSETPESKLISIY